MEGAGLREVPDRILKRQETVRFREESHGFVVFLCKSDLQLLV